MPNFTTHHWHPTGNRRPVPVFFVKPLRRKVRVVDLTAGDGQHLVFRDVFPESLTEA